MSRLEAAIREFSLIEEQAGEKGFLNQIHPLSKLLLTLLYVGLVVSFDPYDLWGLMGMVLYPLVIFMVFVISFGQCIKRTAFILPLLLLVGMWNPLFDRETVLLLGTVPVSGGMVSFLTLLLKGIFSVLGVYLLVVTTGMEKICAALRMLHVPQVIVTVVLFIYRYILVLLQEADRMTKAYTLRAPGQKGVQKKAWGSLAGLLLLRSMDRAGSIYDSMCLRGFDGSSREPGFAGVQAGRFGGKDFLWLLCWTICLAGLRVFPVFEMVGSLTLQGSW